MPAWSQPDRVLRARPKEKLTNVDGLRASNAVYGLQESRRVRAQYADALVAMFLEVVRETLCAVRHLPIRSS